MTTSRNMLTPSYSSSSLNHSSSSPSFSSIIPLPMLPVFNSNGSSLVKSVSTKSISNEGIHGSQNQEATSMTLPTA